MEVSLKKAHKLQKDLESLAGRYSASTSFEISVYSENTSEGLTELVKTQRDKLSADFEKGMEILKWIYALRLQISDLNHEVGIDKLLNALALNGKLLSIASRGGGHTSDVSTVIRKLELTKKRLELSTSDRYSGDVDTVRFDLALDYTDQVKALRREKVNIEDQLTALNAKTMVTISDDIEAFLKSEGIL